MMFFYAAQVRQDGTDLFTVPDNLIANFSPPVDVTSSVLWCRTESMFSFFYFELVVIFGWCLVIRMRHAKKTTGNQISSVTNCNQLCNQITKLGNQLYPTGKSRPTKLDSRLSRVVERNGAKSTKQFYWLFWPHGKRPVWDKIGLWSFKQHLVHAVASRGKSLPVSFIIY